MRGTGATRWTKVVAAAGLLAMVLVGIGGAELSRPGVAAAASSFPVTLHSGDGEVTIPTRPTRILSLSASSTQMLYAIGAGRQVVGVDKYSTWPPTAPRTSFTGAETSAEDYLPLHPDLVVFAYSTGTVVDQLRALHIPTLVLPPATDLAGVDAQLRELGAATGHLRHAQLVVRAVAADLARTARAARGRLRGKTYYVELDPTLYSATSATFIGSVFSLFGMRDIADAARKAGAYPQLSAEYLLKANPDYVILADHTCCGQDPATFAHRPGFSALRAVKDHDVFVVPDSVASQWGPHTLELFADTLRRDLVGATDRPGRTHRP